MENVSCSLIAPSRVLLATDLSARCDRALDRAAQLATQWDAELMAVNVAESYPTPDMVLNWAYGDETDNLRILQRQIQEDLADVDVPLTTRIIRGEAVAGICDAANEIGCCVIVTGMARSEPFGRFLLGTTVEKLIRKAKQPTLVVRKRPHGAYRKILVATDFSEASANALTVALNLFPENTLVLYHAYKSSLAGNMSEYDPHEADGFVNEQYHQFIERLNLKPADRQRLDWVVENGALETTLTDYIRKEAIELVVVSSPEEETLLGSLLGSTASNLLNWLPCDTLIVNPA